jgi:DHA1 family bicyclomycin/chloramphenicol resistance-like MFS transporter
MDTRGSTDQLDDRSIATRSRPGPAFGEFVALMAVMTSLVALSIDAMLPALSMIGSDLGVDSENTTQWVVTMLLVGMALGQLFYGPISDSTGRKRPVYVGFAIFVLGCLLSLLARDFNMMLAGRFLQGLGVAGPRSVSMALIRDLHAGRDMARVMSMIMSVFILVPIAAPAVGQGILLVMDWRAIFGLFLVLAVTTLTWFAVRQPESLPVERREPFSLARILVAVGSVFRHRAAIGFTVTAGLSSSAFVGYLSCSRQIFQDQYDVGSRFVLWFGLLAAAIGLASFLNGRMVMRLGMLRLATRALRGLTGLSLVFLAFSMARSGQPEFWSFMVYMALAFFCVGILFGNMSSLAMEPLGHIAGVGAAVVASVSLTISVILGAWIGQSYDGTVIPLVTGFAVLSLLSLFLIRWADAGRVSRPA